MANSFTLNPAVGITPDDNGKVVSIDVGITDQYCFYEPSTELPIAGIVRYIPATGPFVPPRYEIARSGVITRDWTTITTDGTALVQGVLYYAASGGSVSTDSGTGPVIGVGRSETDMIIDPTFFVQTEEPPPPPGDARADFSYNDITGQTYDLVADYSDYTGGTRVSRVVAVRNSSNSRFANGGTSSTTFYRADTLEGGNFVLTFNTSSNTYTFTHGDGVVVSVADDSTRGVATFTVNNSADKVDVVNRPFFTFDGIAYSGMNTFGLNRASFDYSIGSDSVFILRDHLLQAPVTNGSGSFSPTTTAIVSGVEHVISGSWGVSNVSATQVSSQVYRNVAYGSFRIRPTVNGNVGTSTFTTTLLDLNTVAPNANTGLTASYQFPNNPPQSTWNAGLTQFRSPLIIQGKTDNLDSSGNYADFFTTGVIFGWNRTGLQPDIPGYAYTLPDRIIGFDTNTDTPANTSALTELTDWSAAFPNGEAPWIQGAIRHTTLDYGSADVSSNTANHDYSSGGADQYVTFKMVTNVNDGQFRVSWTGTISGIWAKLPGTVWEASNVGSNGWLDGTVRFNPISGTIVGLNEPAGGLPSTLPGGGRAFGVTGSNASRTDVTYNETNGFVMFNLGQTDVAVGSREIWIRFKLNAGDSLTFVEVDNV